MKEKILLIVPLLLSVALVGLSAQGQSESHRTSTVVRFVRCSGINQTGYDIAPNDWIDTARFTTDVQAVCDELNEAGYDVKSVLPLTEGFWAVWTGTPYGFSVTGGVMIVGASQ